MVSDSTAWPNCRAVVGTLRIGSWPQNLPRRKSVKCQTGAHEGHRADIAGDIEGLVGFDR